VGFDYVAMAAGRAGGEDPGRAIAEHPPERRPVVLSSYDPSASGGAIVLGGPVLTPPGRPSAGG
jgi:hypothetical protein